jgi:hypothetical protein
MVLTNFRLTSELAEIRSEVRAMRLLAEAFTKTSTLSNLD